MTLDEFARNAESWGGDIARWPEGLRAEAQWVAALPRAQTILREQRGFDMMLEAATPRIAPDRIDRALYAVVKSLAAEAPRPRPMPSLRRWLFPAAGLACAVAIGAIAAMVGPLAESGPDDTRGLLTMFFDTTSFSQGWNVL